MAIKQGLGLNKILGTIHNLPDAVEGGVCRYGRKPDRAIQWSASAAQHAVDEERRFFGSADNRAPPLMLQFLTLMKRLLLILLLTLLPLQLSWAAVSGYSQNESVEAAQNFGHHEHKHQAQADDMPKTKSSLSLDPDCGVCHLSCVVIPAMPVDGLSIHYQQTVPTFAAIDFLAFIFHERPERPKWVRVV